MSNINVLLYRNERYKSYNLGAMSHDTSRSAVKMAREKWDTFEAEDKATGDAMVVLCDDYVKPSDGVVLYSCRLFDDLKARNAGPWTIVGYTFYAIEEPRRETVKTPRGTARICTARAVSDSDLFDNGNVIVYELVWNVEDDDSCDWDHPVSAREYGTVDLLEVL